MNPGRPHILRHGRTDCKLWRFAGSATRFPGMIAQLSERLLREAEHDLAHINASLRLFEATGEAADLPPYVDLNRVLRRGETTKICMEALAKEGPLDTRQLAPGLSAAAERSEKFSCRRTFVFSARTVQSRQRRRASPMLRAEAPAPPTAPSAAGGPHVASYSFCISSRHASKFPFRGWPSRQLRKVCSACVQAASFTFEVQYSAPAVAQITDNAIAMRCQPASLSFMAPSTEAGLRKSPLRSLR